MMFENKILEPKKKKTYSSEIWKMLSSASTQSVF